MHFIKMADDKVVSVTQIAGFLPRRIASGTAVPQEVFAGDYLGIIKFGSRVDILLPSAGFVMHNNIKEGDHIDIGDEIGFYMKIAEV